MKFRNGFVSNSSSSSFILVGYSVPKGFITREEFAEKMGLLDGKKFKDVYDKEDFIRDKTYCCFVDGIDEGADRGEILIGEGYIVEDACGDIREEKVCLSELIDKVKEIYAKINLPSDCQAKLYISSRMC